MSEDIVNRLRVPSDLMTEWTHLALHGEAAAEIERLRARVAVLERACRLIQEDPDPHAVVECTGCYRHSRLAFHALEAKP